jgi:hypothetical protein
MKYEASLCSLQCDMRGGYGRCLACDGFSSHQQMHAEPSGHTAECSHFSRRHYGDRSAPATPRTATYIGELRSGQLGARGLGAEGPEARSNPDQNPNLAPTAGGGKPRGGMRRVQHRGQKTTNRAHRQQGKERPGRRAVAYLFCCCGGGLYTARRKRTPEHNPRGHRGGGEPPSLIIDVVGADHGVLAVQVARRGRGAQEDARCGSCCRAACN